MKNKTKILTSAVLLAALLCGGCTDYSNPTNKGHAKIEGHDYIVITVLGNYGQTYVHNPDCLVLDLKK